MESCPLPIEIITDILSRATVDAVMQSKLVCKAWLDVTNHPCFLSTHIHRRHGGLPASSSGGCCTSNLFLSMEAVDLRYPKGSISATGGNKYRFVELNRNNDQMTTKRNCNSDWMTTMPATPTTRIKVCRPINQHDPWVVVGSCNGLICFFRPRLVGHWISDGGVYYIHNPCTGEYATIPLMSTTDYRPRPNYIYRTMCGFGYEPSTDKYKLVRVYYTGQHPILENAIDVYTLGSKQYGWEPISCLYKYGDVVSGVYLNGALYWLGNWNNPISTDIVSFDLAGEKIRIIRSVPFRVDDIGVLGGRLCALKSIVDYSCCEYCCRSIIINKCNGQARFVIWVLNEGNWTKEIRITIPRNLSLGDYRCTTNRKFRLSVVNLPESGKVLLLLCNRYWGFLYDPDTGGVEVTRDLCNWHNIRLIPCAKTFISVKDIMHPSI